MHQDWLARGMVLFVLALAMKPLPVIAFTSLIISGMCVLYYTKQHIDNKEGE